MSETTPEMALQQYENNNTLSVFGSIKGFEDAQRIAKALASSNLVPENYRNNVSNCMIAMEMANRIGTSAMMVMQNLYVIEGKPSWSSQSVIAAINSSGRYSPLKFKLETAGEKKISYTVWEGEKGARRKTEKTVEIDNRYCVAYATDKDGDLLESPPVSMEMAYKEGWITKPGSKWQTMPGLMLRYRAATFFGRLYCPETLMGMHTVEEYEDISAGVTQPKIVFGSVEDLNEKIKNAKADAVVDSEPERPESESPDDQSENETDKLL